MESICLCNYIIDKLSNLTSITQELPFFTIIKPNTPEETSLNGFSKDLSIA